MIIAGLRTSVTIVMVIQHSHDNHHFDIDQDL